MRVKNANPRPADESRRRALKRLAAITCAVVLGSAALGSIGCKTAPKRNDETVGDFLGADKPSW